MDEVRMRLRQAVGGAGRAAIGLALCLGLAAARPARAQDGGRHAAVILELPASPRALALGGGTTALAGDDATLFYNPAQLAAPGGPALSAGLSVQQYFASATLAALSAARHLGPGGGVAAIGIQALDYGSEDEVVPDPNYGGLRGMPTGGSVSAADFVLSAGYAMPYRRLRLGATTKLVRERVADLSGGAVAADLGVAMDFPSGATFAVAAQNLGGSVTVGASSGSLPTAIRFGGSLPVHSSEALRVTANAEVAGVRDGGTVPAAGLEAVWRGASPGSLELAARVGVTRTHGSDAQPVTFGGGVRGASFALDYAYQGFRTIGGATHRLGVRWWR